MLYDEAKNDEHNSQKISRDRYLIPQEIVQSENTSSMYAYVQVFDDFCDFEEYLPDNEGWISLSSNNFVVDNY